MGATERCGAVIDEHLRPRNFPDERTQPCLDPQRWRDQGRIPAGSSVRPWGVRVRRLRRSKHGAADQQPSRLIERAVASLVCSLRTSAKASRAAV
jgi:hypothetical protein